MKHGMPRLVPTDVGWRTHNTSKLFPAMDFKLSNIIESSRFMYSKFRKFAMFTPSVLIHDSINPPLRALVPAVGLKFWLHVFMLVPLISMFTRTFPSWSILRHWHVQPVPGGGATIDLHNFRWWVVETLQMTSVHRTMSASEACNWRHYRLKIP